MVLDGTRPVLEVGSVRTFPRLSPDGVVVGGDDYISGRQDLPQSLGCRERCHRNVRLLGLTLHRLPPYVRKFATRGWVRVTKE